MSSDYALEALKTKRAEMTGEIARCYARLAQLSADLERLDATLRLFAPDFVAESILSKVFVTPKSWSKRGEMSRAVLSILRIARGPQTAREIACQIVAQRGLEGDPGILNVMARRVAGVLRDKREAGLVRSLEETGFGCSGRLCGRDCDNVDRRFVSLSNPVKLDRIDGPSFEKCLTPSLEAMETPR